MNLKEQIIQYLKLPGEIAAAEEIDVSGIKSVCLALGPYRNLTTLTASMLSLHPNCQVLNHAGWRIYASRKLNFFRNYKPERFTRFMQYVIFASGGGKRGDFGGSVTLSHAFTHSGMRKLYEQRFGNSLVKDEITALFWKESLRTSNYIRRKRVNLENIFNQNEQLSFLLPVRNPLDCAVSNMKTGKIRLFQGLDKNSNIYELVKAVLREFVWFLGLKRQYPGRFFYFFQHSFDKELLQKLADFLKLSPDKHWMEDCLKTYRIKPSYEHSRDLLEYYRMQVQSMFNDYPEFAENLLKFLEPVS